MSYAPVKASSQHGSNFTIEEDEEDQKDLEQHLESKASPEKGQSCSQESPIDELFSKAFSSDTGLDDDGNVPAFKRLSRMCGLLWSIVTFAWIKKLLDIGYNRRLEPDDLFGLSTADTSQGVYNKFIKHWNIQLEKKAKFFESRNAIKPKPSLTVAFLSAFGGPFAAAGGLKFIHDSLLFVGPVLLNRLIKFLGDPSQPRILGFYYVIALFVVNIVMSLCLRQYFWWCYRTGMRLRTAVVTSVFVKSTSLTMGALGKRSTGEITNLMSVDSTRLQDLTPYLHACWYSLYQLSIALYFLYQQLGVSCITAVIVIILAMPLTGAVAKRLKKIQNAVSNLRDERVKVVNEVLGGMKVIKLQAWESKFNKHINELRDKELAELKKYTITQAMSGALLTSVPLFVSISTFATYVFLGNDLDVATALTSLALFDLLYFPLFMLPNVLNNLVEAKISVDRVESFLLEHENAAIKSEPLSKPGILIDRATFLWDGQGKARKVAASQVQRSKDDTDSGSFFDWNKSKSSMGESALFRIVGSWFQSNKVPHEGGISLTTMSPLNSKKKNQEEEDFVWVEWSEAEYEKVIAGAIAHDSESRILELEDKVRSLQSLTRGKSVSAVWLDDDDEEDEEEKDEKESDDKNSRLEQKKSILENDITILSTEDSSQYNFKDILALSRISLKAEGGSLIAIIGHVGCGKSSLLSSVLGDMRLLHGKLARKGSIAYVGQRPFIANSTIEENITFGTSYDEERYQRTIFECALTVDLKALPAGDQTEIGERGINLSGGQKARVALARAIYADADLYLLDDPLAAVDSHVGYHIFEECLLKLQERGKTVLLVTNAMHLLRQCSSIIFMKDGNVQENGSYQDLINAKNKDLHEMLSCSYHGSNKNSSNALDSMAGELDEAKSIKLIESKTTDKSATKEADGGKLVMTEEREVGQVTSEIYKIWFTAAGGLFVAVFLGILFFFSEVISVSSSWWLSFWSEHGHGNQGYYLFIYAMISCCLVLFMTVRELFLRLKAWDAGKLLFKDLLNSVLYAPMSFFDTTPIGRILNRFSKDIYSVDEQLPQTIRWYLSSLARVIGVLLYISCVTPLFIMAFIPLVILYTLAQKYYIPTSRELSRLDSISRSPIYALFSETLDGLTTIRAFGAERRLIAKNCQLLDLQQRAYFLNFSSNCWLGVRLELVGTFIITFAALFAVLGRAGEEESSESIGAGVSRGSAFAALAGLSISLSLRVTQSLNWSVRMASDLEAQMVAVERVSEYANMIQEAPHYANANNTELWPQNGKIEFKNVSMRYRSGLPLVLKGVNFTVKPKEKIGIVGRTGSGKSTLVVALLRLAEIVEGSIEIDGINIKDAGLNALRSGVSVIAQDPALFSGTVRSNLDPFQMFSDIELLEGLQRASLPSFGELDDKVEENGLNFSVGQRQLICIARALLYKSKIVLMDEATASVDVETDVAIQRNFREIFKDSTCLTIAHRLNTIMDSDKILVMDDGIVAEFDSPTVLLSNPDSIFSQILNKESS